jgi:hypothetical protein
MLWNLSFSAQGARQLVLVTLQSNSLYARMSRNMFCFSWASSQAPDASKNKEPSNLCKYKAVHMYIAGLHKQQKAVLCIAAPVKKPEKPRSPESASQVPSKPAVQYILQTSPGDALIQPGLANIPLNACYTKAWGFLLNAFRGCIYMSEPAFACKNLTWHGFLKKEQHMH